MKRLTKKFIAIIGTATLAVGLMTLPALAGTTQGQGSGWFNQMQNFMQQTFTPAQHQALMNSSAMQNLRNSDGMQKAMQTGDVKAMQDLMNSDQNVKAQIGQDNLNKMNQLMNQYSGNMITNGNNATDSGSVTMNSHSSIGSGGTMMTNKSYTLSSGSTMMNGNNNSNRGSSGTMMTNGSTGTQFRSTSSMMGSGGGMFSVK